MVYLIYGNQSPTIKSQIRKIVTAELGNEVDDFNFVKMDGFNVLVQDAVGECKYVSLGYDKKIVSLENCYFLIKPKPRNKIESEQDYKELINFVSNNNDDSLTLILSVNTSSVDEKNEILTLIKEKGKIVQIVDPDEKNFLEYTKNYCEKHNIVIDREALNEVALRTDGDVALFKNTIEKLSLYSSHITYDDVAKMVTRKIEDNAFLISNYLLDGRNVDAINLFKDLRVNNVEPVTLISQLASQFRMINQVRYLSKVKRMYTDDIAKELKIKPGRVYVLLKSCNKLSENKILKTLDDLYQLDLQIKSGQVDRFYAFELFLIKFERN